MLDLPIQVEKTLSDLKKKYTNYVEVKYIKGQFCVFEAKGVYNKNVKKTKKITHYLGRILGNGEFVFAKHRVPKIVLVGSVKNEEDKFDENDQIIIKALSMNGRIPIRILENLTKLTRNIIYKKIANLEKKYKIRYIAEIDTQRLGYSSYLILIKFNDKIPLSKDIFNALYQEPRIQLVLMLSGDYDILIHFLSKSNGDVAYFVYNLHSSTNLSTYPSEWYVTPFFTSTGFIPLRDVFFDLLEKDVWVKTKQNLKPKSNELLKREFLVLRELNKNGKTGFLNVDKKFELPDGASRYTYNKLKKKELLKRVTVTMNDPHIKYNALFLLNIICGGAFRRSRVKLLLEIIKDTKILNKYVLVSDIGIPEGGLFIMPVLNEIDFQKTKDYIQKNINGVRLKSLTITLVLLGSLCYRKFDNTYRNQYRLLVEDYRALKSSKLIDYEED